MNKQIILSLIVALLLLPIALANNIEVIIEHKSTQPQINTFSLKNLNTETQNKKFDIQNVTQKEFQKLKQNPNLIVQKNIQKHITLDVSVPLIDANKTWNLKQNQTNITGASQTVCVLDTGAQTDHPDLIGKNATCNIDCITDSGNCSENCSLTDENGHGTHVSGIIVSSNSIYTGVTLNTKYIPIITCDSEGNCPNTAIWTGIEWCIENKEKYNISVISMSLGEGQFDSYCDTDRAGDAQRINNATQNNITVITATGNTDDTITNNSAGISNPACIKNSIRIGNTDKSDKMTGSGLRHEFFSDIITAPGVDITSTYPTNQFATASGTSMSTPHVSGTIALLNQYKKLESNTTLTPSEIKQFILDSGKIIYDSETGQNYTRINSYQTILYADESPPIINLISPQNSSLTIPSNQTFSCNATDMQLKNLTLQVFNSTGLLDDFTNSSPVENKLTINKTFNLSQADEYTWNCYSYDNKSNYQISSNYTISTKSVKTTINSPTNNSYTNQNQTIFNCSAQNSLNLTNMTFSIYNSTDLLNTSTKNITGTDNQTTFNYTLQNETTYFFNCLTQNNESYFDQTKNHSIIYDITSPKINLTSPANNTRTQTKTHTFTFNETELNKDFCNLTINSINYQNFTQPLTDGNYKWNISCTDKANNTNTSKTFNLEIYTEPAPTSSGSSSSSSSSSTNDEPEEIEQNKTYSIEEEKVKGGFQQEMNEKDSIKLKIKSKEHTIILNEIKNNSIEITIKSNPINVTLYKNQPAKINLDSDNLYDLELLLIEVDENAKIFAKEINQTIPNKHILQETPIEKNQTKETPQEKPISTFEKISKILKVLFQKLKELFFKKVSNYIVERNIY